MAKGDPTGMAIAGAIAVSWPGFVGRAAAQQVPGYGGWAPGWMGPGMMEGTWHAWWPMMMFGGILWIVVLVLAGVLVAWLVRGPVQHTHHYPPPRGGMSPGLDVLDERYARGEIDREEYLKRRQDILGRPG